MLALCHVQGLVAKLPSPLESATRPSAEPCATWIQSALPSPFTSAKKCCAEFTEEIVVVVQLQVVKVPSPLESPTEALLEPRATWIQSARPSQLTSAK